MKKYIVYDNTGKILRTGTCPDKDFFLQAQDGEFAIEGIANDVTQKIINVGISGKIINKSQEEIEAEKPAEIPFEKQKARITKGQWQEVLDRISVLESEV